MHFCLLNGLFNFTVYSSPQAAACNTNQTGGGPTEYCEPPDRPADGRQHQAELPPGPLQPPTHHTLQPPVHCQEGVEG